MNTDSPFRKAESLLSPGERAFYPVLEKAVADRWEIHSQVRLEALTPVADNIISKRKYRNQVQSKAVDFVLCRREDHAPVLVIEWDDWRHRTRADRRERDELVDSILQSVGLPILHIRARSSYDPALLEQQITDMVQSPIERSIAPTIPISAYPYPQQTRKIRDTQPLRQSDKRAGIALKLLRLVLSTALTLLLATLLWLWAVSAFQSIGAMFPTSSARPSAGANATTNLPADAGPADSDADAIVATANLNMRAGPGRDLQITGTFPEGTPLKVLGKDPTEYWLKVMVPSGKTGWMSGRFLKLTVQLSDVPVVSN